MTVYAPIPVDSDTFWPRGSAHRFRVYGRKGRDLRVLATAPDHAGVGVAIGALDSDCRAAGGEFGDYGALGVLDVLPEDGSPRGHWIINPWSRPE